MNGIWKGLRSAFFDAEVEKFLSYLDEQLKGQEFLMGALPGRPDFLLSFVYDNFEQRKLIKTPPNYPLVQEWSKRCKARPAWKRSLEKGNGYDCSTLGF
jgi:glutathione S-transferase